MSFLPRTRGGALWRSALAAVLVIAFAATATAVAGLLQVNNIVVAFNQNPALAHARVVAPAPGAPETLLLIGSDHRASAGNNYRNANTDTMMLVRVDDSSSTINVLSIPRDLAVMLPDGAGGTSEQKLNAAYSIGGPNLLVKTLQQQVLPGLQVNHILDVNFAGFSDLIDAIGCVYADVDHRYYNISSGVTGDPNDYSTIYIEPGYQKLCGDNQSPAGALAFVRFRHTDSDEMRNARQQDFLRWAKEGYSASQLLANEQKLIDIFGKHVTTDDSLHTTDGILELFGLVYNADGHTIKSIHFPEYFGNCNSGGQTPCYVYANGSGPGLGPIGQPTSAERAAYEKFLTPTAPATSQPSTAASTSASTSTRTAPAQSSSSGLAPQPGDGRSQAGQLGNVGFPVLYPTDILSGSAYCFAITGNCDDPNEPATAYAHAYPRKYVIHGTGGGQYRSYVMTLVINSLLGEYYTVQGTTWQHPPILKSPSKVTVVHGKKLFEYEDGGKLALVAYHTPQAVYWISNTLDNQIGNGEMVAMAASLTPAG